MFDKPASPPVLYEPPLNCLMITFFGVGVLKSLAYKKPITLKQGFFQHSGKSLISWYFKENLKTSYFSSSYNLSGIFAELSLFFNNLSLKIRPFPQEKWLNTR